jgi:hypothetical protein
MAGKSGMTEKEWLACTDPFRMLGHLGDRASRRKRQLFCLACWGQVRHLLTDEWSRKGLALLGRFAERDWRDEKDEEYEEFDEAYTDVDCTLTNRFWDRLVAGDSELYDAMEAGTEAALTSWDDGSVQAGAAFTAVAEALWSGWVRALYELDEPPSAAELAARIAAHAAEAGPGPAAVWRERQRLHAELVREVFGNPFRPAALDPAWLTREVRSLAETAYRTRKRPAGTLEPGRLAVLGDALEDAGCTSAEVLAHLRSGGPHVRGCWALDLCLGRE